MAGTRRPVFIDLSALLTCIFLGLLIALMNPIAATPAQPTRDQAAQLTQQGQAFYNQGDAAAAFDAWGDALRLYQRLNYQDGILGTQINQSSALLMMGHPIRSCEVALQGLQVNLPSLCRNDFRDSTDQSLAPALETVINTPSLKPIEHTGLLNLAEALRLIGRLAPSRTLLQLMLDKAPPNSPEQAAVTLSLAQTDQTFYFLERDKVENLDDPATQFLAINSANQYLTAAQKGYQQVISTGSPSDRLYAQIYQLALLTLHQAWLEENPNWRRSLVSAPGSGDLLQLERADFSVLPPIQQVFARLNFAQSLAKLGKIDLALSQAQTALQTAQRSKSSRGQSFAWGTIGELQLAAGQPQQAETSLLQALNLANAIRNWDSAYRWQQQLGRYYAAAGELDRAKIYYKGAIANLNQVRINLQTTSLDVQFSFRNQVEPTYREYLALLLNQPNPDLNQALEVNDNLQLMEVENFLRCGRLDFQPLQQLKDLPPVISVMNLGDRQGWKVIVRALNGSIYLHTPNQDRLRNGLNDLWVNLNNPEFASTPESTLQIYLQVLYQELIEPIRAYLPPRGTLLLQLDSSLQFLPFGLLYDGNRYLVENYSLVLAGAAQSLPPQKLKQLNTLFGGISKEAPSFTAPSAPPNLLPLPGVVGEGEAIGRFSKIHQLLNQNFTLERVQTSLTRQSPTILHLATHGQFSSDPQQTVILSWNQAINAPELDQLVRPSRSSNLSSIELLILSACETAKGDRRSSLGLAGVAARAGARSTVASLWLADDQAAAQMMAVFYKELQAGLPKAEALRQAQLSLRADSQYRHPFQWANFVLVGSWL